MIITFAQPFLSIREFPTVTLPNFTLVTGPNGAGKSHLLRGLLEGALKSDAAPDHNQASPIQRHIRLFDWSSIVPDDAGAFSPDQLKNEQNQASATFSTIRIHPNIAGQIPSALRQAGITLPHSFQYENPKCFGIAFLKNAFGAEYDQVKSIIDSLLPNIEAFIYSNTDTNIQTAIRSTVNLSKKSLLELTPADFLSNTIPNWGRADLFKQSFGRLFVAYRNMFRENQINQWLLHAKGQNVPALSDEEYLNQYGIAPWDFVNKSLEESKIDFAINAPDLMYESPYEPKLTKRSNGAEVKFSDLSSGEKVLMSFAFCVYYATDKRQLSERPKLILLDEIDAPLHPSMSRSVVDSIVNVLVKELDIKVIATTHSPSTVAIAPEESIYVMQPGQSGLHKTSKSQALNVLTVGVPTLSISFDGRRQVFVESPDDVRFYSKVYTLMKASFASERSLEFIATGTKAPSGSHQNTGCDVVRRIVRSLAGAGNKTVFGLIDWDGKNDPDDRIEVLAHNSKNGIENVILDPLLVCAALFRSSSSANLRLSLGALSYFDFLMSDKTRLQLAVSNITTIIFGNTGSARQSTYHNGLNLLVDDRFFTTDDHQLGSMILTALPELRSIAKHQKPSELIDYLLDHVLYDKPGFTPQELLDPLNNILSSDA